MVSRLQDNRQYAMSECTKHLHYKVKVKKILDGKNMLLLAPMMLAQKITPLSVPTATVKLSTINKAIRTMPAIKVVMTITTNCLYQSLEHCKQCELPSDRLSPGWQTPHSTPERIVSTQCIGSINGTQVDVNIRIWRETVVKWAIRID